MTEHEIQVNVTTLLRSHGRPDVCWFAVPNGEQRKRSTGARLKAEGVQAGAPDMMIIVDGRTYGLELKTETGTASPSQRKFGPWMVYAGANYHTAYGLDDAFKFVWQIGALKPHIKLMFPNSQPTSRRLAPNNLTRGSREK